MATYYAYYIACAAVFAAAYTLNVCYITVFYHRGLAHRALDLRPWSRPSLLRRATGSTGLDPKAWIAIHRPPPRPLRHPARSPQPHALRDRRSHARAAALLQEKALRGLKRGEEPYTSITSDLGISVNWLRPRKTPDSPLLHLATAAAVGYFADAWLLAGIVLVRMSATRSGLDGVNSFGHSYPGYATTRRTTTRATTRSSPGS